MQIRPAVTLIRDQVLINVGTYNPLSVMFNFELLHWYLV